MEYLDTTVMTNNSTTRGKCKEFRGKPKLGLWMWCIVLKSLITLPCVLSRCQGIDISLSVYPDRMIILPYGTPLEIFCVTERETADDLDFYSREKIINSEKINVTTRRLYIEHLDRGVHTYYCKNTVKNKSCVSRVLVDRPPSNVTDFSCISKNFEKFKCTWTSDDLYSKSSSRLISFINGRESGSCIPYRIGKLRSCSWSPFSIPTYKQMEDHFYFQLDTVNPFGSNTQTFIIDHFSVVKPDPPEQLEVLSSDAHSVLLRWKIPLNILDFLPCRVVHKIEYQKANTDSTATTVFHSVDTTNFPPKNITYTVLLSNLPYANSLYEVRISIKPVLATDQFWSNFTYVLFKTGSERPQRPPNTIAGAFDQSIYENKRLIYVYWQQLEENEEAGADFSYKVFAEEGSNSSRTLIPDKNKSLSYVKLNDASLQAIDVSIWSNNVNGTSINSSHLYIPSKADSEDLKVDSFTKLAYQNGTYKLLWAGNKRIDNYTLFWCELNINRICKGRMNFTVLDSNQDSHVIDLPRDSTYQFAISANNGSKSSGMTWASCDISGDTIPLHGMSINVYHGVPGKSFVNIFWTMYCMLPEGIIKGYLIKYCPLLPARNVCDTTIGNQSTHYVSDPKQMEMNITDLEPSTSYQFTVALNTTYGVKSFETSSTVVTTL